MPATKPHRTRHGLVAALAIVAGAFVGLLLSIGSAAPAQADNAIVSSTPAEGGETTPQLAEIVMRFANQITGTATVQLVCAGDPVTADPVVGDDGITVTTTITGQLPEGTCRASWTTYDADNNEDANGILEFSVSAAAAAAAADAGAPAATDTASDADEEIGSASSVSSGPIWLGRVLSTIGISVLFGSLVVIVAAWPEGPEYVLALRFFRTTWIVGIVGTFIYVAALSGAVRGESFGSGFNPGGWFDLFDAGWPGRAAVLRIVFVLASGWVVMRPERVIDPTTNMLALGIPALAVVTLGLSRTGGPLAFLGVIASVSHVLAMAVWFGGVVLLARVVLAGPGEEDLVHAVHGFSRVSSPAIVVTVVSGLVQLYRLDGGELFSSGHGRVLLLKTVAVATMIFVGLTARQLARARLAQATELHVRAADRMRRAFGTEAAIGIIVLLLSGWMMSFTPGKVSDDGGTRWAVSLPVNDQSSGLELEVLLRPGRAGGNDLRVEVASPETGVSGLTLTFVPLSGGENQVTQEIPLTGAGAAQTAADYPIPLEVPGRWELHVSATTPTGAAQDVIRRFEILNADGSTPPVEDDPVPRVDIVTAPQPTGPVLTEPSPETTEAA